MNLTIIAVVCCGLAAGAFGIYHQGRVDGRSAYIAEQKEVDDKFAKVKEDAMNGAAEAIAKISIKQVTIQGQLRHEIETHTIYRDCQHTPDGLRSINAALTNSTDGGSIGSVQLPASAATP